MKLFRRSYEERVDAVVNLISDRRFPVQLFFLKDNLALGVVRAPVKGLKKYALSPPGTTPEMGLAADTPVACGLLQDVLRLTEVGYVPKGVIRDAVRETWRRKFNELQMEKVQAQLDEKKAAQDHSADANVVNLKE